MRRSLVWEAVLGSARAAVLGGARAAVLGGACAAVLGSACDARPPAAPMWTGASPDGAIVLPSPTPRGTTGRPSPSATGECRARLLVIFDRSGSMADAWASTGEPKWRVAATALERALTPLADRLEVGGILFPSSAVGTFGACPPVDPIESQFPYRAGPDFLFAWADRWSRPELMGSTPIDSAFDSADAALSGAGTGTAVVLLTDGEPTCSGPVSADVRAAEWHARGIDTWVIGLPGAHGASLLEAVAEAGGTGSALSVDDPAALTDGLGRIVDDALEQACPP